MKNEKSFELREMEDGGIEIQTAKDLRILFTEKDAISIARQLNTIFALRLREQQEPQGKDIA